MSKSDLSRRAFLRLGAKRDPAESTKPTPAASQPPLPRVIAWLAEVEHDAADPPLPARARDVPVLRPPGAVAERDFMTRCTRCNDCLSACPHDAIVLAPPSFGKAAGTPRIDPGLAPCHLCPDTPCISACTTGALVEDGDPMGTAWVQILDCLGSLGTSCSVCAEHCPVPGAIAFAAGIPTINASLCTGCGKCHYACPAPQNAIAILPNPNRRTPRSKPAARAKDQR